MFRRDGLGRLLQVADGQFQRLSLARGVEPGQPGAASARLVRDFYAALTVPGGRTVIDVRRAAVALNHATLRLRERYRDWPTFWAGHIHTGP
jgi:hypothetical protein